MSDKIWKINSMSTSSDQTVNVQPTPEFDGIELWFTDADTNKNSGILYITDSELPELIERLQTMMDHVIKKK